MKKKLNEIFDEAKAEDLDQFSDELNAPELPDEVLASVKGKVYAKTKLKKDNKTSKSVWLRFGAIAACFVLIVSAVITVPMFLQDKNVELGEDGKINILSMPGAMQISTSEKVFLAGNGDIYPPEDFVYVQKNNGTTIIYGSAKNVKTVSITDGDLIWYITTFEIDVIDAIKKVDESSAIKATSISCYEKDSPYFIGSLSSNIMIDKNVTGLFLLKSSPTDKYEINGEKYSADEFASYYAMSQYDCDGKSFNYYGTQIELDALRDH